MIINITAKGDNTTDLSWLSHKNPDKLHSIKSTTGEMYLYFSKYTNEETKITMVLDVDTLNLTPKSDKNYSFDLKPYINDKPYVLNSFFATAMNKILRSAMAGELKEHPELLERKFNFIIELPIIWSDKGELFFENLLKPLGYQISINRFSYDQRKPEWGLSNYYSLVLEHPSILYKDLLNQLYILLNLFDEEKHYYTKDEEEKLNTKGKGWLEKHPISNIIKNLYLDINKSETNKWFKENILLDIEESKEDFIDNTKNIIYNNVINWIKNKNYKRIVDIGSGRGGILYEFGNIDFIDSLILTEVSEASLRRIKDVVRKLGWKDDQRISVLKSSLFFNDIRLLNQDIITIIDVINFIGDEMMDDVLWNIFGNYKPKEVIITYKLNEKLKLNHTLSELKEKYLDKIQKLYHYNYAIQDIDSSNFIIYFQKDLC